MPELICDGVHVNWEICLRDAWGRPGERIGGLTGPIYSPDSALSVLFGLYPELGRLPLIAVCTPLADAGPDGDGR